MSKKSPTGCRSDQLFGLWFMDDVTLDLYRERAVAIDLESLARQNADAKAKEDADGEQPLYANEKGVAVINVSGPTTKYPTSFSRVLGGTSTMMVERALNQAAADADVRSIMLHMDSAPGGTVAGAFELVDRIQQIRQTKPVVAHGSDQMTSAGYLFASACDHVTANRNCMVGSIGVRSQLTDTSKQLEKAGIRVIPIASGKHKAAGLPGTPVTDEQVAEFQREVDALNDEFVADVAKGRGIDPQTIREMEARCYVGKEAKDRKLVDGICSFEAALGATQNAIVNSSHESGGILVALKNPMQAAPRPTERKTRMSLLTEIRKVFGADDMTEEAAIEAVRSAKARPATTGVTEAVHDKVVGERDEFARQVRDLTAKLPKEADPELLKDRADLVIGRIDLQVSRGDITPAIAAKVKELVVKDGKAIPFMLTSLPELGNVRPIEKVIGLFDGAKLAPAQGERTLSQREIPGGADATEAEKKKAEDGKAAAKAYSERILAARAE